MPMHRHTCTCLEIHRKELSGLSGPEMERPEPTEDSGLCISLHTNRHQNLIIGTSSRPQIRADIIRIKMLIRMDPSIGLNSTG